MRAREEFIEERDQFNHRVTHWMNNQTQMINDSTMSDDEKSEQRQLIAAVGELFTAEKQTITRIKCLISIPNANEFSVFTHQ